MGLFYTEYFLNIAHGARSESEVSTINTKSEEWPASNIKGLFMY